MAGLGRRSHYRKHLTDAVLHDLPEPDESLGQRIARVVGTRGGNMFDVIVAPPAAARPTSSSPSHEDGRCKGEEEGEAVDTTSLVDKSGNGKAQSTETSSSDQLQEPPIQNITQQRTPQLAFLPTKFRKLVWIKRNDFVIVECGDEEEEELEQNQTKSSENGQKDPNSGGGFRYVITHILYKDQVKHIKSKGLWPSDPFFADEDAEQKDDDDNGGNEKNNESSLVDNNTEKNDGDEHNTTYEENGIVFDDPLGGDDMMMMVNTNRIATLRVEDSSSEEDSDEE